MTAAFASSPWPAPSAHRSDKGWRFAQQLEAPAGWCFDLRRNVSISPRQLIAAYLLLCSVSLLVAGGFWWHGVGLVVVFTGIELVAVGVAMLMVARHAGDRETVTLSGREVAVEQRVGPGVERVTFRAEWLRVEPAAEDGSLVELSGEGRSVRIGRHVRPELRVELARELRRALRLLRSTGDRVVVHEQQQ
ncbi:DUF2244 domain-containing protein [Aquabacterium sp. OR-4]|uniref:DUF2244 domain-containing protein n=1 Tax=Aquabacterium sp. OR-4 TaxID=2978127 RepID=UPI0021B4C35C|nr:DUF2244 domain-containing protein [Aquabacterium sp. OR-4]MDT7834442.1 DUF2244 domain-containing protein [Aquabacterium sp. OR-4]